MDVYLLKPVDMSRTRGKLSTSNNRGLKLATTVIDTVTGIFLGNDPTMPDRCGRRLPHASRVRRRLERLGRDRGGRSGGPVDHGAGRDEPGRLADRRPVAGGVRGRRRDAD